MPGFDNEANLLVARQWLAGAIRWVGGLELELFAIATNGRIVPRFEDLTAASWAPPVPSERWSLAPPETACLWIEDCANTKAVTSA